MKILNKKIAAHKSSAAWLQRQASDPYVARAHRDGYRARAAYKLILLEYAFDFAQRALKHGGVFVAKSFTGGTTGELIKQIKSKFDVVHHIKPPASRKDSVEMFIVAIGYHG